MQQFDGRVTTGKGGQTQVLRPDGTSEGWWNRLVDMLGPLSSGHTEHHIVIRPDRVGNLPDALARHPATDIDWSFDGRADATIRLEATVRDDLEALVALSVDEQEATYVPNLAQAGFTRTLRPFQIDAVARLVAAGGGANFSVPGSGKTTTAYAVFAALRISGTVNAMIVVAPPSAFEAWETEADECFTDNARPRIAVRPELLSAATDVVVLNYERLQDPTIRTELATWARSRRVLVVFDEAHRAKAGLASQRGAASAELARQAPARMVLTGTPMPNGENDLVAVFDLVWPGHGERLVKGVLASRMDRAFVRVTKDDLHLPPLDMTVERVPLEPNHRALYDAMLERVDDWANGPEARAADAGRALMRLIAAATNPAAVFAPDEPWALPEESRITHLGALVDDPNAHIVSSKIVRAAQIVDANRRRGRKTLVWSSFVNNVEAVAAVLTKHNPAVIMGSTPVDDDSKPTDRRRLLDTFRHDPDCWALVATPQTLGEGVSLHHTCIDQIHVDRGYAAGTWLQSLDRTHRLGLPADADPTCTVLMAQGTIDERINQILGDKVRDMATRLNDRSLRPVADPMIVDDDTVATVIGDLDALRELISVLGR